jgi:hypothetical protein
VDLITTQFQGAWCQGAGARIGRKNIAAPRFYSIDEVANSRKMPPACTESQEQRGTGGNTAVGERGERGGWTIAYPQEVQRISERDGPSPLTSSRQRR